MANMSYCRFHNTNLDMRDCIDALYDGEALSDSEFKACRNMFGDRRRILFEIVLFGERNCYEGSKRHL